MRHRSEGGLEGAILERIARDVYRDPARFGFRDHDDVGEAFSRFWERILGLIARYRDNGAGFEAYVASAFRFFALTIRRDRAIAYDREAVVVREDAVMDERACHADAVAESIPMEKCGSRDGDAPTLPSCWDDASSPAGAAFRSRIGYLCAKCAHLLDDAALASISRATSVAFEDLLAMVRAVRERTTPERARFMSRRRGRDAAWLRMCVNARRLERQCDPELRSRLLECIERDRRLYRSAVADMRKSRTVLSNRTIAAILGIPKATVDSGVTRLVRQFDALCQGDAGRLPLGPIAGRMPPEGS